MGYDVHITRKPEWFGEEGPEISLEEWTQYVTTNSDFRLDGFAETGLSDGQTLRLESEGLAVWLNYSGHQEKGNKAWFLHSDGNVVVKNPDDEILRKMYLIAQSFSAKVQGEECEVYNENAQALPTGDEKSESETSSQKNSWWQFWK